MYPTSRIFTESVLSLALAFCSALAGAWPSACQGEEGRAWVIMRPDQLRDLYLHGELTDSHGSRWEVGIVPGIVPQISQAQQAVRAARSDLAELRAPDFWPRRRQEFHAGIEFAREGVWKTFLVDGVHKDYRRTNAAAAELLEEKPFAWAPRLAGDALGGYLILPAARIGLAPAGTIVGVSYSVLAPARAVAQPPLTALARTALSGIAHPATMIALHHPIYAMAIMNPEPAERHDGRFWLRILSRRQPPAGNALRAAGATTHQPRPAL